MKARIKSTGDIMPIAPYARVTLDVCDDRGTPYEVDFEDIELINEDKVGCDVDWSYFRREAAKDILCAVLGRVERFYTGVTIDGKNKISDHKDFIKLAIEDADELIKQLRDGKE